MRTIRISQDVWNAMAEQGKFGDTPDDVLRKVFNLGPSVKNNGKDINIGKIFPPDGTKCKMFYKGNRYDGHISGSSVVVENLGTGTSLSSASYLVSKTYRNGWRDWWFLLPGATDWIHADEWRKENRIGMEVSEE